MQLAWNAALQEDIICLLTKWKTVARGNWHESVLDPVLHRIFFNELHDINVLGLEGEPPLWKAGLHFTIILLSWKMWKKLWCDSRQLNEIGEQLLPTWMHTGEQLVRGIQKKKKLNEKRYCKHYSVKVTWIGKESRWQENIQICQVLMERGKLWNVLSSYWDRMEMLLPFSESNMLGCSSLGERNGAGPSEPLPALFPLISVRHRCTSQDSCEKLTVQRAILWLPLQAA